MSDAASIEGPARRRRRPRDPPRDRPTVSSRRGARRHGPERLGQVHAVARAHGQARATRCSAARSRSTASTCWRCRPWSGPRPVCSSRCSTRPRCRACASTTCSPRRSRARGRTPTGLTRTLRAEAARIGFDERFLDRRSTSTCPAARRSATRRCSSPCSRRRSRSSTSSTPASTSTRCAPAPRRIEEATNEHDLGVLAITHYSRLLHELQPDRVHILVKGRIVASGGPELADELERDGYAAFAPAEAEPAAARPLPTLRRSLRLMRSPDPFAGGTGGPALRWVSRPLGWARWSVKRSTGALAAPRSRRRSSRAACRGSARRRRPARPRRCRPGRRPPRARRDPCPAARWARTSSPKRSRMLPTTVCCCWAEAAAGTVDDRDQAVLDGGQVDRWWQCRRRPWPGDPRSPARPACTVCTARRTRRPGSGPPRRPPRPCRRAGRRRGSCPSPRPLPAACMSS